MRPATMCTAAVLAGAGLLAGCATSDREQVRQTVMLFATSAASHDYGTICDQVLAPVLTRRLQAGGITCRQAMAVAFDSVSQPQVSIGKVTVHGADAEVITLSTARGQTAAIEAVRLVRTGDGWRISALASPLQASTR